MIRSQTQRRSCNQHPTHKAGASALDMLITMLLYALAVVFHFMDLLDRKTNVMTRIMHWEKQ